MPAFPVVGALVAVSATVATSSNWVTKAPAGADGLVEVGMVRVSVASLGTGDAGVGVEGEEARAGVAGEFLRS